MRSKSLILAGIVVAVVALTGCGEHPYYVAGEKVTLEVVTALDAIKNDPFSFAGKTVMVEGIVDRVCQGSGCWATLFTTESGETLFTKSPDHSVIVPKSCSGERIRVQGEVVVIEPEPVEEVEEVQIAAVTEEEGAVEGVVESMVGEDEKSADAEEAVDDQLAELDVAFAEECEKEGAIAEEGHSCPKPDCYVMLTAVELYR